ncbi:MAG TPA: hypothetical protein DEB25_01625 [Desulfobulbaceae bacterium]|nr:hypothetical protein [Desulfobulbaceae bacterium]
MRKHYYFLFTSDDGTVWRLSCNRKRLIQIGAATAVFFILFTGLGLRSAALGVQSVSLSAKVAALERQLAVKDTELLAQQQRGQMEQERLEAKVAALTSEKDTIMATAVRELSSRSALIDEMLTKIGLNPEIADIGDNPNQAQANANIGGPFIAPQSPAANLLNRADLSLATLSRLPLGMPTYGSLTSPFGNRTDPLNGRRAFHAGIDFKTNSHGRVFATADGVVKQAGWNGNFGRYVEIDHENGYSTAYAHLRKFTVKAGKRVQRGEVIGYVGSSGRSTGPHLHYELRYQGLAMNPHQYIRIDETIRVQKQQKLRKR